MHLDAGSFSESTGFIEDGLFFCGNYSTFGTRDMGSTTSGNSSEWGYYLLPLCTLSYSLPTYVSTDDSTGYNTWQIN